MRKLVSVALVLGLLIAYGCNKHCDQQKGVQFKYAQTYCADPWRSSNSDDGTINDVQRYFDSLSIPVSNVSILNNGIAELCSSCSCLSGKNIYLRSDIANTSRLEMIGFKKTD